MNHALRIKPEPLALIESGAKTVEGRLASRNTRKIQAGDTLDLACADRVVSVAVIDAIEYPTFTAMIESCGVEAFGRPSETVDQIAARYRKIYWYPGAEEKGIIAIRIAP